MKKIIFILALFVSFVANAQKTTGSNYTYINQRYEWLTGIFQALGLPSGSGPAAFKSGQDMRAGAVYYDSVGVDAGFYIWTGSQWVLQGTPLAVELPDALLQPGYVTYSGTGFKFYITPSIIRVDGVLYGTDQDSVTLSPSDPDDPRIDVIYVATTGIEVAEGIPAGPAAEPQLDGGQFKLTHINIPALSTTPGITVTTIYDENTAPEWIPITQTGTTIDADQTAVVFKDLKALNVGTLTNDDKIQFPGGSTIDISSKNAISGFIKLKATMSGAANLWLRFFNGATVISNEVKIALNKNTTAWQAFSVPITNFTLSGNTFADRVQIRYTGSVSHAGFYKDYFHFETGLLQPGGTGSTPFAVGPIDTKIPTANGATIQDGYIYFWKASQTNPGMMSAADKTKLDSLHSDYFIENIGDGEELATQPNDSTIGIKSLKAGTNVTLDVTDTTVTINSSVGGGGTDNTNAGAFYRWLKPDAQEIKTLAVEYGILADSASNTDAITLNADTASSNGLVSKDRLTNELAAIGSDYSNFYIVSTISDLQTYLAGLGAGVDVNIWFPAGTYTAASTITIDGKGKVRLFSEGAIIENGVSSGALFNINNVTGLDIKGLNIDMDLHATSTAAFTIDSVFGVSRIHDVDVYNFGANGQFGFTITNSPTNSLAGTNNLPFPGISFSLCNFYNETTVATFDYNSNNTKGIAIYAVEDAEYGTISDCKFNNINTGVWLGNGANWGIDRCNFNYCNARNVTPTGVIYADNVSAVNGGKLTISDCKFNHNWSYSVWIDYNAANRPTMIDRCEFIANAITPIVFNGASQTYNSVTNSWFDRANLHTTGTNDPYAAVTERFISATNSFNNFSNNIFRTGVNGTAIYTSAGDNQTVRNNVYNSSIALASLNGSSNVIFGNTTSSFGVNSSNVQYRLDVSSSSIPSYSAAGYNPALGGNTNMFFSVASTSTGGGFINTFTSASNTATGLFVRSVQGGTAPSVANTVFSVAKHNGTTNFTDLAATEIAFHFRNNATNLIEILGAGRIGFGVTTPTAILHLKAGTTAASTAPLKFNSGSLQTTAEAGAMEFLTDKFYGTITTGAARKEFTLNDAALTSGRIPFVTTNGRLTDVSTILWDGTTATFPLLKMTGGSPGAGKVLTSDADGDATWTTAVKPTLTKNATIENPTASENMGWFRTPVAITITNTHAVLVGTGTPSVTYQISFGTDITSLTNVYTAGQTVTSTTTGDAASGVNDATIPANSWIRITTSASTTTTQISLSITYTED